MFTKVTRINEDNERKELLVDTDEIVFLSETKPHICYDKPIKFEDVLNDNGEPMVNEETGEVIQEPTEWETEERFLIAFKNGRHPQFLDRENYEKLSAILLGK